MKDENTRSYVIDASFLLSYLLPDEKSDRVTALMLEHKNNPFPLYAPTIIFYEVSNALKSAVKSKRIRKNEAYNLLKGAQNLKIKLMSVEYEKVLELAIEKDISFYDASYISLAKELNTPLLTLDKKLEKL